MMMQIESKDRQQFSDAVVKLTASIEDLAWRVYVSAVFVAASEWMGSGRELPGTLEGILASAVIRIVLQHMYHGFPLALPMAVIDAYAAAGEMLETPLFDCEACGYGLPRAFQACPLCGGRVGLGAYAARRGRRAVCN